MIGARSRHGCLATRAGAFALVVSPLLLLTACSSELQSSFCTDYQHSWNEFTSVRDDSSATPEALIAAGQEIRERWEELRTDSGAPEDVTGMLGISLSTFSSAWSASSPAERGKYERSLANERGYIALQCSKIDADIDFSGDVSPIETPKVN